MKKILLISSVFLAMQNIAPAQTATNALIEEFSSATCNPCAYMNNWLDPLFKELNANKPGSGLVVLKYQMNFPSYPNLDASYNNYGYARSGHYIAGMTSWGIPLHFCNGKWEDTTGGFNIDYSDSFNVKNEISAIKATTAKMSFTGTYKIKTINSTTDSIYISVTINPTANLSGGVYRLYVAATERYYQNTNPLQGHYTSQTDFYHVMRKMYPTGSGATGTSISSFTSGTPQTFTFADKITDSFVSINGYNWWANPYDGNVVVFVADESQPVRSNVNVLQADVIPAQWATDVQTVSNFKNIKIAPNPTSAQANIYFNIGEASHIGLTVTDLTGRSVYTQAPQYFDQGLQHIVISTDNFAAGTYFVRMSSENGNITERLSVIK